MDDLADSALLTEFADGSHISRIPIQFGGDNWGALTPFANDVVAFAGSTVHGIEVHIHDARAGTDDVVRLNVSGIARAIAIDPRRQWLYADLTSRRPISGIQGSGSPLGEDQGIWRFAVDGSVEPQRLLGGITLTQSPNETDRTLSVTSDGAYLVDAACPFVDGTCSIRVVDLRTLSVSNVLSAMTITALIGVTDGAVIGRRVPSGCTADGCPILIGSLTDGHVSETGRAPNDAQFTLDPGGAYAAYLTLEDQQRGETRLHSINLTNGSSRVAFVVARRYSFAGQDLWQLPAGWIALAPEPCFPVPPDRRVLLIRLEDGFSVRMPKDEPPPPNGCNS